MSRTETGPEKLRGWVIAEALAGCTIGREILVLDDTPSTNDHLFALATPKTAEGLIVMAERQTAGRGQHGRRWDSAPHVGLWLSILLRPRVEVSELPQLTAWAAETVATVVRSELSLVASVKPPNDVYIGARKVAGVLLEMRAVSGAPHVGILGIGLNLNQTPEDFPEELRESAGSLAMAAGRPLQRESIAIALLRQLDRTYRSAAQQA